MPNEVYEKFPTYSRRGPGGRFIPRSEPLPKEQLPPIQRRPPVSEAWYEEQQAAMEAQKQPPPVPPPKQDAGGGVEAAAGGAVSGAPGGIPGMAIGAATAAGAWLLSKAVQPKPPTPIGSLDSGNVTHPNNQTLRELLDVTKQMARAGMPIKDAIKTTAVGSRM